MKKVHIFFVILIRVAFSGHAQNQPAMHINSNENIQYYDVVMDGPCDKAREFRKKAEERSSKYERDVEDYKKGLFCFDCKRSASEIMDELHITLMEHLKTTPNQKTRL
jgi:hypothetical protein